MRSSVVRRLPIPARLLVTLGVPLFALCAVLGSQVNEARVRGQELRQAISRSAVLQAASDLQSCVVQPESVRNGLTPAVVKKADLASAIMLNTLLEVERQGCVTAGAAFTAVVEQQPGVMSAEATVAFAAQWEALRPVLAGDFGDAAIQRLASARQAADDALTDMFVSSNRRISWFIFQGVIELQRARYNEVSAVMVTLSGLGTNSPDRISGYTGARVNAVNRSRFGIDATTRAQIDEVISGPEYAVYTAGVARAVDIAAGKQGPVTAAQLNAVATAGVSLTSAILSISTKTEVVAANRLRYEQVSARNAERLALAVAGLTLIVTLLLAVAALQSILRPLRELTRRAGELAAGRLDGEPVPLAGRDELTRLAQAMESSAATLLHVNRQARAMADGRLDDPSLEHAAPGPFGQVLHSNVLAMQGQAARLRHDAEHDPLTGLLNRTALAKAVGRTARPEVMSGTSVRWLLYLDLDGFKQINDEHGHEQGDDVLRAVSERLMRAVRPGDVVSRLGGDEFAVVLTLDAGASEHELDAACARISEAVQHPVPRRRSDSETVAVGVSIGRALVPATGVTLEEAMAVADAQMYADKKARKARAAALEGRMLDLTDIAR